MNADGWITVKTRVDDKQLAKDINSAKKQLDKLKKKESELKDKKVVYEVVIKDNEKQLKELEEKQKKFAKGSTMHTSYQQQIDFQKMVLESLEEKKELENINSKLKDNAKEQQEINKLIDEMNAKLRKSKQLEELGKVSKDIKGHIKDTVKQIGKWALAVFGIRSAYLAIRSATSTLSQYNEKIAADIEYIRYSLATALQPLIERLINLVYKFLGYINLIAKAWFNVDLFARASAKSMNKASKSAKEMQKTLLGFDEINQLQDNSSSGGDAAVAPSIDLSNMDIEVPGWLQWILDNKDVILGLFWGIVGALAAMKLSEVASNLGLINGQLTIFQALGIGAVILSIYELVKKLSEIWEKFDSDVEGNNTTLKDWGEVIAWVGVGILGLALIIGSLPVAVAAAIVLIIGLIMKNWENIKTFFTEKVIGWIDKQIEKLEKTTLGKFVAQFLYEIKRMIKDGLNIFDGLFTGIKQIFDGIIMICKGDFKNGFISVVKGIGNILITILNTFISGINAMVSPIRALIVGIGKVLGKNYTMDNIKLPSIKYLESGGIVDVPKTGVSLRSDVRAGENGPEGVLPLTNPETMSTLGREIGKWVTINLDLNGNIDGRTLLRVLKTIDQRDKFARNGG